MEDITVEFCNGFRDYLLDANQLMHSHRKLSRNSAAGYWSTFRGFLNIAYRDHKITENVNDYLEPIDTIDTHRQYLTLEELQALADTRCVSDVLRRASLFSCLTGLRFGDIRDLGQNHNLPGRRPLPANNNGENRNRRITPNYRRSNGTLRNTRQRTSLQSLQRLHIRPRPERT